MKRIAVLGSGFGSNLQALMDAQSAGVLGGEIVLVVANNPCVAIERAERAGIPTLTLPLDDLRNQAKRAQWEAQLADGVAAADPDLVVLAGWMVILRGPMLNRFGDRMINLHPALLPDDASDIVITSRGPRPVFRGAHAVRDALAAETDLAGASVHWVTAQVDVGTVIESVEVPILPGDTEESLHARIGVVERVLLPRVVAKIMDSLRQ